jgi:hypothetical protein
MIGGYFILSVLYIFVRAESEDSARRLQSGGSGTCSSRGAGTYPYVPDSSVALSYTYKDGLGTTKTITTSLYGYEFQSAICGYNWMVTTNSQQADYNPPFAARTALSITSSITFSQYSMASERSYLQCVQSSGYGNVGSAYGQDGQTCMPTSGSGSLLSIPKVIAVSALLIKHFAATVLMVIMLRRVP